LTYICKKYNITITTSNPSPTVKSEV